MDFDRERELEDAGIDALEFSLMDEDERRQVLEDNYLDPDDYDMIDLEPEFQAWENLQSSGLSLNELSSMDDDEKKAALEDAGLDADDYGVDSGFYHYSYVSPVRSAAKKEEPKPVKKKPVKAAEAEKKQPVPKQPVRAPEPVPVKQEVGAQGTRVESRRWCYVRIISSGQEEWYLTGELPVQVGDYVEVPIGATGNPVKAVVYKVRSFVNAESPVRVTEARTVYRIVQAGSEDPAYSGKSDEPVRKSAPKIETYPRAVGRKKKKHGIRTVLLVAAAAAIVYGGIAYKQFNDRQQELVAIAYAEESYLKAQKEFAAGNYTEARKAFYEAKKKSIGDSEAWYWLSSGLEDAEKKSYSSAKRDIQKAIDMAESDNLKKQAESLLLKVKRQEELYEAEQLKRQKEEEKEARERLAKSLPYVGMSEADIANTVLGAPSATVRHNYQVVNGDQVLANLYDYTRNGYVIFTARCVNGKVTQVWDDRDSPYKQSSGTGKKTDKEKKTGSQYPASDYYHPDDFYYDYYDDFYDYEDAEDYWEEYG